MAIPIPGQPNVIAVPVSGPQGPQGPTGATGPFNNFEPTQSAPASAWIIDHNLARKVHVSIFSLSSELVFADVIHGTINQTTINFSAPTSGSAVIS